MHCKEVRRLLREGESTESMRSHVAACDSCRRYLEAERLLSSALSAEASRHVAPDISVAEMKSRIASGAGVPVRSGVIQMAKKIVSKPGFAVGFSVSIVALLVALLVPITFESSVGYTLVYEDVASSNALQKDELVESMKSVGLGSANVYQSNRDSLIYLNIAGLRSESQMKVAQALIEAMTDKAGNMVASRVQQRVEGSLYARAVGEAEQTVELQSWIDGQTNEEVKLGVEKSLQMAGIKDYKVTVTSSDDEKTRTVKLVIPQKLTTEQTIKILGNEIKLGGPYEDIALSLPDIKNMSDEEIRIYLRAKLDSIGKKDADIKVDSTDDGLIEIRIKPDSN